MLPVLAGVLAQRGTRAYVFRGIDGLDELTTTGPSTVHEVGSGDPKEFELDPPSLGLPKASAADLAGGDPEHNADVAKRVLEGEQGPARHIVLLNAAAALTVAGLSADLSEGLSRAPGEHRQRQGSGRSRPLGRSVEQQLVGMPRVVTRP